VKTAFEIKVPQEIVNDDFVTIVGWQATTNQEIHPKQVVVLIETSKTVFELEAEAPGYLEILQPEGAEAKIGETIGLIHDQPIQEQSANQTQSTESEKANVLPGDSQITMSRKAQDLVEKHTINPEIFSDLGMVREKDVIQYLNQQKIPAENKEPEITPAPQDPPNLPDEYQPETRGWLHELKSSADTRDKGVLWLAFNYFWRNWLLGNLADGRPEA